MTDKLLKWKDITGLQARNRIIYNGIEVSILVTLFLGTAFGFILPALIDWSYLIASVDMDKLGNSTADPSNVRTTALKVSLIGLLAPLVFIFWLSGKIEVLQDKMFRRLSIDIGYKPEGAIKE